MVIPAVVEKVGVQGDAALLGELAPESLDAVQCACLIVGVEVAQVVPRVVVKKRPVGVGPLLLQIAEEIAAHLTVTGDADDR